MSSDWSPNAQLKFLLFFLASLGVKPRALHSLAEHSTIELLPQPHLWLKKAETP